MDFESPTKVDRPPKSDDPVAEQALQVAQRLAVQVDSLTVVASRLEGSVTDLAGAVKVLKLNTETLAARDDLTVARIEKIELSGSQKAGIVGLSAAGGAAVQLLYYVLSNLPAMMLPPGGH